jgi:hypothetical protein
MKLPVKNGTHLGFNCVGSHFANYDSMLVLSHLKGYAMGGFGGALKNISIGIASSEGRKPGFIQLVRREKLTILAIFLVFRRMLSWNQWPKRPGWVLV